MFIERLYCNSYYGLFFLILVIILWLCYFYFIGKEVNFKKLKLVGIKSGIIRIGMLVVDFGL